MPGGKFAVAIFQCVARGRHVKGPLFTSFQIGGREFPMLGGVAEPFLKPPFLFVFGNM